MVPSSSVRLLAVVQAACLVFGCWTGRVYERGRIRESVVRYESAVLEGDRIVVDYTVALVDANGDLLGTERRSAAIARDALGATPEIPVEAFPVEVIDGDAARKRGGRPLALVRDDGCAPEGGAPWLDVVTGGGRDTALHLVTEGAGREGILRSEALYRNRTAWWAHLLAPFAAALDVAMFPLQVVSVAPFFIVGD